MNQESDVSVESVLDEYSVEPGETTFTDLHFGVLGLWGATDLSYTEIADTLGTTEQTVHKYIKERQTKRQKARSLEEKASNTLLFVDAIES